MTRKSTALLAVLVTGAVTAPAAYAAEQTTDQNPAYVGDTTATGTGATGQAGAMPGTPVAGSPTSTPAKKHRKHHRKHHHKHHKHHRRHR